jgi:hypothetical protein
MMAQVWLIADRPSAVIQTGQPPAQQAAWLLDVPAGKSALQTAADFAGSQGFPSGTVARVVDLAASPITIQTFQLQSQWVAQ